MMADLVEAERKKREKREASKTEPAETAEPVAVDSDSNN